MRFTVYVHVADNSKALDRSNPNYDKLCKVCPLLNVLSKQSSELYNRHPQLSLDESMIATKCSVSFIQSKKPVKWEIEVWMCADSLSG